MVRATQLINTLTRLVRSNPDKARTALDAVEKQVNQRTGGKYADQMRKGRSTVDGRLGIPQDGRRGDHDATSTPQAPRGDGGPTNTTGTMGSDGTPPGAGR